MRRMLPLLALVLPLAILAVSACGGSGEGAGRGGERSPATNERSKATVDCPAGAKPAGRAVVTLFHETHTHGSLAGLPPDRGRNVTFAQYVGLRNALRSCLQKPENSLFLGNGDDVSPELNGVRTDGQHTIDAFNAARIDADTFGFSGLNLYEEVGGDFAQGLARLRELVAASRFAWVSANVREGRSPDEVFASEQGARLWVIREVGGVRIGITGLLGARATDEGHPGVPAGFESSVRVLDPVRAMREVVPQMRATGAQIIVVLSHMLHEDTLRTVRAVKGIDVAVGTHHPGTDAGEPPAPEVVNGAIVAVAGPDEIQALGQLDLGIRDGRIVDYAFQRHVPPASGPVDSAVEAAIQKHLERS